MASGKGISVAVEKAVHNAFADMAQNIMDQHGIQVNEVTFDWIDTSTQAKKGALVSGTHASTSVYRS